MRRPATILGLLTFAVMIVATIISLSDTLNERHETARIDGPDGNSASSDTPYVPCASCDARHKRLGNDRSGKD